MQNILFLGATGYIGGSVLWKLLQHAPRKGGELRITVLVRDPAKAEKFKELGVVPVVGSIADLKLVEELAGGADVIFSCADADNLTAAKAALAGCKSRFEKTGQSVSYIHTSGAGIIADLTSNGMHADASVWDDLDTSQLAKISPTAIHRDVDLELIGADEEGYIKSYIVAPTTVWGIPSAPLVKLGLQNPQSTLISWLVSASLGRKQGGMVGEGKNVWQNVQVDELADLYILLYSAVMADPQTAHGQNGIYFAENGEHMVLDVSNVIARTLFENGKGKSGDPTPFSSEEMMKYFGPMGPLLGSTAKCRSRRGRSILGWKPTKTTNDMLEDAKKVALSYVLTGRPM